MFPSDPLLITSDTLCSTRDIPDEETWTMIYKRLTDVLHKGAHSCFDYPKTGSRQGQGRVTNPTLRAIVTEIRRVNRLLSALSSRHSHSPRCIHEYWARNYISTYQATPQTDPSAGNMSFDIYLKSIRKTLSKLRYREEKAEMVRRQDITTRNKIRGALFGGSAKKLYGPNIYDPPPLALSSQDNPDTFITSPEGIKTGTMSYFNDLFYRNPRSPGQKPWMTTPSVLRIKQKTSTHPFVWPNPLSVTTLRGVLRKGTPRPSPGPDGWEKWWLKAISDRALQIVVDLLNFEITKSCFPAAVKPTIMATIHKRGARTQLANTRGVCFSNQLVNIPFAWLNSLLVPYIAKLGILPQGQIATQPGVQGRDLVSFLAQIETWSNREKQPVFALSRDQKKGFDKLEPQGFYDAVEAYGLPLQLIDFDRAAQADVPYRIKTAYGLTDDIVVSGVTKQGLPLSPLKATLTTSLGNHWLHDEALSEEGALMICSHQSRINKHHLPNDSTRLPVVMVEAMDDSYLFARTRTTLRSLCLRMETFQAEYGWVSNWSKSLGLALNAPGEMRSSLLMPTVDTINPLPECVPMEPVQFVTDHAQFLRIAVNDPEKQFLRLQDLISEFQFPVLSRKLPLTAMRKIVSQCLISKIRPRLSLQPISKAHAEKLDAMIAQKVHAYLAFPFPFNSAILTLPISLHGFDFPSISRLNDAAAVAGLQRDLNHHIPAFRDLAKITLTDWTCSINHCCNPLDGSVNRTFIRQKMKLPWAWIMAQQVLQRTGISVRWTDQSHILRGDVAIEHLIRSSSDPPENLPRAANNLSRAGLNFLNQFGTWQTDSIQNIWRFSVSSGVGTRLLPLSAASRDWPVFREWLASLSLTSVVVGDWTLAVPREDRRAFAEQVLKAMIDASPVTAHPLLRSSSEALMASDGSCIPGMPKLHERRSTTFSTVGNRHAAVFSIAGRNSGILQAEVYGLVSAALQASRNPANDTSIYTDHLNSSRLVADSFSNPPSTHAWATKPGRSLYRWLMQILTPIPFSSRPAITYTQAHTDSESLEARANAVADALASRSHYQVIKPATVPDPTFCMDEYTFFTNEDGYIESNISSYISHFQARATVDDKNLLPFRSLYDLHAPPDHPYVRAPSSYSAVVQLYARSHQLPTAFSQFRRSFPTLPWCRAGCRQLETPHHIFVECPSFEEIRTTHELAIVGHTRTLLESSTGIFDNDSSRTLITRAKGLLRDHPIWPTGQSQYFLGMIPSTLESTLTGLNVRTETTVAKTRFVTRLANTWHTEVIRVASRIWGELQRRCNHERNVQRTWG